MNYSRIRSPEFRPFKCTVLPLICMLSKGPPWHIGLQVLPYSIFVLSAPLAKGLKRLFPSHMIPETTSMPRFCEAQLDPVLPVSPPFEAPVSHVVLLWSLVQAVMPQEFQKHAPRVAHNPG